MQKLMTAMFGSVLLNVGAANAGVVTVKDISVSSTQEEEGGQKFGAKNLKDAKQTTGWAEGADSAGLGSWVQLNLGQEVEVTELKVWNGNWYTMSHWKRYNRVQGLEVEFSDGSKQSFELADKQAVESLVLDKPVKTSSVKLKIKSIHRGVTFSGTTVISEVQVLDASPEKHVVAESVEASSVHPLTGDGTYEPENMSDGVLDTMWCEHDEGPGNGQWIQWNFGTAQDVSSLTVHNGNGFSFGEFMKFNAVKNVELAFSDGSTETLAVKPSPMAQQLSFSTRSTNSLKLTITEAKKGTNDLNMLCISEVKINP